MEVDELGINALVQNIHFLSDCADFEIEFPWHNRMIQRQCAKLKMLVKIISIQKRMDLVIGLFHIPGSAVRAIIYACLKDIKSETFLMYVMKQAMKKEYCQVLATNVTTFLTEG